MKEQEIAPQQNVQETKRFESDTQKIVRRHLENKDDVITEEDIRSVRIGLTPPDTESDSYQMHLDETKQEEVVKKDNTESLGHTGQPHYPIGYCSFVNGKIIAEPLA